MIEVGSIYRHFKGKKYLVVGIATNSEDLSEYVVYKALYGDNKLWIRPINMFTSKVDKNKYPESNQEYRFEKVEE